MPVTRQPENSLYHDNSHQLPGPAPVLASPDDATDMASGDRAGDLGGAALAPYAPGGAGQAHVKSSREWLLLVIWRQKWVVAATVALTALIAAIYLASVTPRYVGQAVVQVRPLGLAAGAPSADAANWSYNPNYLNAERDAITGDSVLAIACTMQDVLQTDQMRDATDPIATLRNCVSADVDKNSNLIIVSAFCPSAQDAATLANGVVTAYELYQTRSAKDQSSSIQKQMGRMRDEEKSLNVKIQTEGQQLHDLELKWGVLSRQDDRTNIIFRRLQALSEALTAAQADEVDARMKADALADMAPAATTRASALRPAVEDDDELPVTSTQQLAVLEQEMEQTETQLRELEQRYMPEHPLIYERKHRLAALKRSYYAAVQRRAIAARLKVQDFQEKYDQEQRRAVDLDAHAAEYSRIKDEQARDIASSDAIVKSLRAAEMSRDMGDLQVDRKEAAKPQAHPAWPNRGKTMSVALAVGLSLGLLLACMWEWVDDRFRSAGEIKASLGMPLLAVIPQSTTKRSPSVSGQRILLDPGSDTAEAYRSLRAVLLYSLPEGDLRTLLVTSPCSGDGKTTLVSNLAIAMAQSGRKVLIVDADLRSPSQHDIFGVKNNIGLSALLAGRCSLETAVQRSHVPNLEILPCGPAPANPVEILNSREFGETLDAVADKYDCVVIDSSPAETLPDARIISASCDGTVIVLNAQTAHRRTTEHTRDALIGVGARVLGVVVNDLPRRPGRAYGGRSPNRSYVAGLTTPGADTHKNA